MSFTGGLVLPEDCRVLGKKLVGNRRVDASPGRQRTICWPRARHKSCFSHCTKVCLCVARPRFEDRNGDKLTFPISTVSDARMRLEIGYVPEI